jgi:arylsulfatase
LQRGFEKYYGILGGGGSYYNPLDLASNNQIISAPKDFYLTNALSDSALAFMQDHIKSNTKDPFFCYLAYLSPHRPLHALKADIEKYKGAFKQGWDVLRSETLKKLISNEWINKGTSIAKKDRRIPDWVDVSGKINLPGRHGWKFMLRR